MRTVLFHRDLQAFQGGHLKVRDYFEHVRHTPGHQPRIHFSEQSTWDERNPWQAWRRSELVTERWRPADADVLFLAGMDWLALSPAERARPTRPVLNLIQHVRHAEARQPLRPFLRHRAIRISVSQEVQAAIEETGEVNGPVVTIANTLNLGELPRVNSWAERDTELLIAACKAPDLGRELARRLTRPRRQVKLLTEMRPRGEFLAELANARVTLLLPHATEGFYLPALEAMALGCLVVVPDCIGNRSLCVPGVNSYRPAYKLEAIAADAEAALVAAATADRQSLLYGAAATVARSSHDEERRRFQDLLLRIKDWW
jgi:hypothetical protein